MARDCREQVNPNSSTTASRIMNFSRINSHTFFGSKVHDYLQGFIDKVFKVIDEMGVFDQENWELATDQPKYVTKVLYEQWKKERSIREGLVI